MTPTITSINPWMWNAGLGFDQAQLVDGHTRELWCSGQDAVDSDGKPQHPGDLAPQLEHALDNLEQLLGAAHMSLANVVRLNVYTTDVDALFADWTRIPQRFAEREGGRFATSILGVTQLAAPGLMVLLEATAVD